MENKNKNGKGSIVAIVILLILVIALGGYIGYDKLLNSNNNSTTKENSKSETNAKNEIETTKEKEDKKDKEEKEKIKEPAEKANSIKTRTCTGVYSGTAAVTQNIQTGQYDKGTITIELKSDGTYELKKENVNGASGAYTIIENTLLLKTAPDTCGPGADCSAKYTQYLNISEDCSTISMGYGSHFFYPNFTLTKQS